jgi:hypothetical protein
MTDNEQIVLEGLVTIEGAMDFLDISRASLYRLINDGTLPTVKLIGARRIPRRALIALGQHSPAPRRRLRAAARRPDAHPRLRLQPHRLLTELEPPIRFLQPRQPRRQPLLLARRPRTRSLRPLPGILSRDARHDPRRQAGRAPHLHLSDGPDGSLSPGARCRERLWRDLLGPLGRGGNRRLARRGHPPARRPSFGSSRISSLKSAIALSYSLLPSQAHPRLLKAGAYFESSRIASV